MIGARVQSDSGCQPQERQTKLDTAENRLSNRTPDRKSLQFPRNLPAISNPKAFNSKTWSATAVRCPTFSAKNSWRALRCRTCSTSTPWWRSILLSGDGAGSRCAQGPRTVTTGLRVKLMMEIRTRSVPETNQKITVHRTKT